MQEDISDIFHTLLPKPLNPVVLSYVCQVSAYSLTNNKPNCLDDLDSLIEELGVSKSKWDESKTSLTKLVQAPSPDDNPLLKVLENPLSLNDTHWHFDIKERFASQNHGTFGSMLTPAFALLNDSERVSGKGSSEGISRAIQQKLNLELTAASATSGNQMTLVNMDKLKKAEQKLQAKQDRRRKNQMESGFKKNAGLVQSFDSVLFPEDYLDPMERSTKTRDIKLENFDVTIAGKHIIKDGNLSLPYGRRIGLVGRNGIGKSTLLRAISTRQLPIAKYISILHVEQEAHGDESTPIENVLKADIYREALLQREAECLKKLSSFAEKLSASKEAEKEILQDELGKIYARLEEIESDTAETRASIILAGLGFAVDDIRTKPTKSFSGGWRMRLALARALFCKPDLLLLDEPTNMLDIPAVFWLQNYLLDWKSTVFVVSHDREFLDVICTDTVHLHHERLDHYKGNFQQYIVNRDERRIHHEREYESNIKLRAHLQEFIDRWRYNAARAALAQSKIKVLEKLPIIEPWPIDPPVVFKFESVEALSPPIIQLDNVTFGYSPEKKLFSNVSFTLEPRGRVAIVGPNGAGKTTILNVMTGKLEPLEGRATISTRIRFAYFAQHHVDFLGDLNQNALQFFASQFPQGTEDAFRRHLGSFGLSGSLTMQSLFTLSGGQKSRLVFAKMSYTNPHVLILDEPTNHLDTDSIDALVQCLEEFEGAVIIVSHDTRFVEKTCNQIMVCDKGKAVHYPGTIRNYVASLL